MARACASNCSKPSRRGFQWCRRAWAPKAWPIATRDLRLADQPADFARHVVELLRNPQKAEAMAARAREEVVTKRDMRGMTERLVKGYRAEMARKRSTSPHRQR